MTKRKTHLLEIFCTPTYFIIFFNKNEEKNTKRVLISKIRIQKLNNFSQCVKFYWLNIWYQHTNLNASLGWLRRADICLIIFCKQHSLVGLLQRKFSTVTYISMVMASSIDVITYFEGKIQIFGMEIAPIIIVHNPRAAVLYRTHYNKVL